MVRFQNCQPSFVFRSQISALQFLFGFQIFQTSKSVDHQAAAQSKTQPTPLSTPCRAGPFWATASIRPTKGGYLLQQTICLALYSAHIKISSNHGRHCLDYHCGCLPHWIACCSRLHGMDLILPRPSQTTL